MFNKKWVTDTAERVIYTMAETAIGVIGGASFLKQVDWKLVASAVVLAGLVTLLKCIIKHNK